MFSVDNNLMIDNMPQQNSPSQSSEAGVLIPVWKAGERDEGKHIFFNKLSLCIRTVRPDKNKGGRKHGADIGERTLGQQAVGQREGKKAKRERRRVGMPKDGKKRCGAGNGKA